MNRIRLLQSSSTKLAIFFSALLLGSVMLLFCEIYSMSHYHTLQPLVAYGILGMILFICGGLFFISFYVTKRINTMVDTADSIIATRDLTRRIPIDNPWDDLSKLAQVFNSMLTQIEHSVASIRQVSDNIAHDLRTPLTRLRTHIETMRMEASSTASISDQQINEFSTLIHECDALMTTFNALLRIANIESGRRTSTFERINLSPVIADVVDLYEPTASEKNINLSFRAAPAFVNADKDLLFQAFANLLDNAIKHTPENGTVVLTLEPTDKGAKIVLTDTGIGIDDAHKPHVFNRFYRVDSSRCTQGAGLGLSLVQAIIKLHQGSISLSDHKPSGLIITITL